MTAEAKRIVEEFRKHHGEMEDAFEKLPRRVQLHYDKDGSPLTLFEWCALFEDLEYRQVALDAVPPFGGLSTVWTGLNHNYSGVGPPIIFETLFVIYGLNDERGIPAFGDLQVRYSTLNDALAGHAHLLAMIREDASSVMDPDA